MWCTLRRSKKESEEEKSVGKRKEKAKTRREAWEREAREAKKAGKNEKAQKKRKKKIPFLFITKVQLIDAYI